jgi:hypothetical protein
MKSSALHKSVIETNNTVLPHKNEQDKKDNETLFLDIEHFIFEPKIIM